MKAKTILTVTSLLMALLVSIQTHAISEISETQSSVSVLNIRSMSERMLTLEVVLSPEDLDKCIVRMNGGYDFGHYGCEIWLEQDTDLMPGEGTPVYAAEIPGEIPIEVVFALYSEDDSSKGRFIVMLQTPYSSQAATPSRAAIQEAIDNLQSLKFETEIWVKF